MNKKLFTILTLLLCVCSGAWADSETIFSATATVTSNVSITKGTTDQQITAEQATITGGSMYVSNGETSAKNLLNSGAGPSSDKKAAFAMTNGKTIFKVVMDETLQAGDVISALMYPNTGAEDNGLWFSTSSSRPGSAPSTKATTASVSAWTEVSYTVTAEDGICGETTFYIHRATGTTTSFTDFKVTREGASKTITSKVLTGININSEAWDINGLSENAATISTEYFGAPSVEFVYTINYDDSSSKPSQTETVVATADGDNYVATSTQLTNNVTLTFTNVSVPTGVQTWDLGSVTADDIKDNTTFWKKNGDTEYQTNNSTNYAQNERIMLENNYGNDLANGIRFMRTDGKLAAGKLHFYIGRGIRVEGTSAVVLPTEVGSYYRVTYARGGGNATYGYKITSGAEYVSGDLKTAFANNEQRPSFIIKATATEVVLTWDGSNYTTFNKLEKISALVGQWSTASDEIYVGDTAPAVPAYDVIATDGTTLDGSEYSVVYSLKEGSTDGIVEWNASDGITAIHNNVAGEATVVATLTSLGGYMVATETQEYTITVNARTNTSTVYNAAESGSVVLSNANRASDNKSATIDGIVTIYDHSNNTGIQNGTQTFTVNETSYTGLKLSANRYISIKPANDAVVINQVTIYVRANGTDATTLSRKYKSDTTYDEPGTTIVGSGTSTPTEIIMKATDEGRAEGYNEFGMVFGAQVQAVILVDYTTKKNMNLTIKETGYATLYTDFAVAIPEGVEAYTGTLNSEKTQLTMKAVSETIPANTGVILHTETPGTYNFVEASDVAAIEGNALTGTLTEKAVAANSVYTLGLGDDYTVGLRQYSGTSLRAYSAYMEGIGGASRMLSLSFGGSTTGVQELNSLRTETLQSCYNLNGQRVVLPTKGLYIVNGKKVVVK